MTEGSRQSHVLTLVFTDLVGSTDLKTRKGDHAAGDLMARHRAHVTALAQETNGRIIDWAGDGCFMTYEAPSSAVVFALKLQMVHAAEADLPAVRVGIHMGEVTERSKSDGDADPPRIEGLAVDLASRIESLAQPGQTLMSAWVFDSARQRLTSADLGAEVAWRAHGPYEFKGLDTPVEICETGVEGVSPLAAPEGSDKAHRAVTPAEEETLGWRPAVGLEIPHRHQWHLEERLGEGGFGEVWLAVHEKTGAKRVFKFCFQADRVRGLKREVVLFRLLKESLGNRDDIAQILEWEFDKPPYYLEAEYTEAGDLIKWSGEKGGITAIPLETRLELVAQVAVALGAAHSVGVLHKDIKPSNILISEVKEKGIPRASLTDFGIGLVIDPGALLEKGITAAGLTQTLVASGSSSASGTRMYMAPEVIEGKTPTTLSDIYALGVVLYQAAIGDLTHALASGWERDIEDTFLREDIAICVDGHPEQRIQSATELAERLRGLEHRHEERRQEKERRRAEEEAQRKAEEEAARADRIAELAQRRRRRFTVAGIVGIAFTTIVALFAIREYQRAELQSNLRVDAEQAREYAQKEAERATIQEQIAVEAKEALRKKLYFSDITLAEHSYNDGNIDRMSELLLSHIPEEGDSNDPRHFEWFYWWGVAHSESRTVKDGLRCLALTVSPDGKTVAVFVWPRDLYFYDVTKQETVKTFSGQGAQWDTCWTAFSPDGSVLAAVGPTNRVYRWNTQDLALPKYVTAPVRPRGLAFSPVEDEIACGGEDGRLYFWNTINWAPSDFPASDGLLPIWCVAYSPDGSMLAAGTDGGRGKDSYAMVGNDTPLILWDTASKTVRTFALGHKARIISVAWSPDGSLIVTGSADKTVRLWNKDLSIAKTLDVNGPVNSVSFSPNGQYLAAGTGTDNAICVWQTETWKLVATFKGHSKSVVDVNFTANEGILWSAGVDGRVKIWDLAPSSHKHVTTLQDPTLREMLTRTATAMIEKDGRILFCFKPRAIIERYDLEKQAVLPPWNDGQPYHIAALSDDGALLAGLSPDGLLEVWETDSGRSAVRINLPLGKVYKFTNLAISRDAKKVLFSAVRGGPALRPMLFDTRIKEETEFDFLGYLASFTPDGKSLLVEQYAGEVVLIEIEELRTLNSTDSIGNLMEGIWYPNSLAFSPDEKMSAAPMWNNEIQLNDLETRSSLRSLRGHSGPVNCAVFSGDGRRLVSGGDDSAIRIWDVETGDLLTTLKGHSGPIHRVAFTNDGNGILSLSRADGTVSIWHAPTLQELKQSAHYWTELAEYHRASGETQRVANEYGRAMQLSPPSAKLYRARGNLNVRLGRLEAAAADYLQVLSLGSAGSNLLDAARSMATRGEPLAANTGQRQLTWQYTFDTPDDPWNTLDYDASAWETGTSPFRSESGDFTPWNTPDIWLRCEFNLDGSVNVPLTLTAYIDDDVEFYINGVLAGEAHWAGFRYQNIPCSAEASASLRQERNVLALHCYNSGGDAHIDAGLYADIGQQAWTSLLTKAIAEEPTNIHLLLERFHAYQQQGDAQSATADAGALIPLLDKGIENDETKLGFGQLQYADLIVKRAEAYEQLGQWEKADADWQRTFELDPYAQNTFDAYVKQKNWSAAAAYGLNLVELKPNVKRVWLSTAAVLVLAGNESRYRSFCEQRLAQYESNQLESGDTCKICLLIPDVIALDRLPVKLFEEHLDQGLGPAFKVPWDWAVRALVAYRGGDAAAAIPYIQKSQENEPNDYARTLGLAILALAQHELGKTEEAQSALASVSDLLANLDSSRHDWLIADILRREAELLINGANREP